MKKIVICSLLACFSFPGVFSQSKLIEKVQRKGNEVIIPYEKYILPNGLTAILHEDHSDPIVHVDVTYHVGSAREEIGKSGFAHFFEHMMFQGSDHVGDEQHFKLITAAGGTLNGTTNLDRTNYFETVPSNQLEKMLWLEADRMGFLLDAVTQEKFEIQRSTVKNERGQNYDNRPYGLAGEYTSKTLYPYGHPYSWLTIGYVEDLNRVNVQDLKNFFLRWYGPNNATITIGGDIKPAEALKLIEKYFGSMPKGPAVEKTVIPPVAITADRYVSYTDNYARIPQLTKTYPTVPNYNKDMAALACLAQIIGYGKNSVLYQEMVKTQKALDATAYSRLNELNGEFTVQITPLAGGTLGYMDSLFADALRAFEKRGVKDEDIVKFKGSIEAQLINGLQSVAGKVSQLAAFQTFTNNPNMIGTLLGWYRSVSKEDVMRVYNQYIKNKGSVTLSVLTKQTTTTPARPDNFRIDSSNYKAPNYGYEGLKYVKAQDKYDRTKMPEAMTNPEIKVPAFWKKELPGGIRMIGSQNSELPIVNISVFIPGGHLALTGDTARIGLASLTAGMLNEGTKNYTAEQIFTELQKLGSTISVNNTFDGFVFTLQSLKMNLDKSLALLEERILQPDFTQDAFTRLQKQALESFKQAKSQPSVIAGNVYRRILYPGSNILGLNTNGNEYTIRNLRLTDIQSYYASNLTSKNARVVIVGDVSEAEVLPKLGFLGKLPDKDIPIIPIEAAPAVAKTSIYLVDVPKAAQTEFRIGTVTDLKYDAVGDFYRADLMNYVLGSNFNSRLNIMLREEKGWTYGARSSFTGDKYTGTFGFSSGIRADATDSALVEIVNVINGYAADGITDEELTFMKSALGQRDALSYETLSQKAGFIGRILEYDLPAGYIKQQNEILRNMTKEEINTLAKKWLNTSKVNILLVGDKSRIMPGIQKLGYEIIELDSDGNRR